MVRVFLAFGSNLGDRRENILEALQQIAPAVKVRKVSSFYETEPVGYENQPMFLNAVCEGETNLSPTELLKLAKEIEKEMGRKPSFRNAPRPIDVDILLYNNLVLDEPELTIPHPRMAERFFVLVPLVEIAPELKHPVLKSNVREMLEHLGPVTGVKWHSPAP